MSTPTPNLESAPTFVERVLQSDRVATVVLLVFVPAACWGWIVVMARDAYGPMTGASRWMMTPVWDAPHTMLLWAMWAVMMTGMMLPSAAPLILLYGAAARRSHGPASRVLVYTLASGYLSVWVVFSLVATALQRLLASQLVLSPMVTISLPIVGVAFLLVAGLYQLTPMKQACLHTCQTPLAFLIARWRVGVRGAFRLGAAHGFYCVGCCWALMLLLFVGGVMNLTVIFALTVFVALEKSGWAAPWSSRVSGLALLLLGLWMLRVVL